MLQNRLRLLAFIPLILALGACNHDNDSNSDEDARFLVEMVVSDTFDNETNVFAIGQQIKFALSLTNEGSAAQDLSFGRCPANITIEIEGGAEVWHLSNDAFCSGVIETVTLNPGDTHEEIWVWDQEGDDDNQVAQGDYVVTAWFQNAIEDELYGEDVTANLEIQ